MKRRDGVFKRNRAWWIDYTDAEGRRHRKKAAPTYELAKLIYRDTVAAIAKGEVLGLRDEGTPFRAFVEQRYWPTVASTWSRGEQVRARAILDTQVLPRFGNLRLPQVTREAVERWIGERLQHVSGATVNKELMRMKHVLNRAVAWRYLKDSPARGIARVREAPGRVRYLSDDERERLLSGADVTVTASDGRTWTRRRQPNGRLRLYIVGALHTGARLGELTALTWADVDFKARTVRFVHTKNGHARTVPMTDTLRALLLGLPRPLSSSARVLPQHDRLVISRSFARLVADLGIANLRFHDLRHDAASQLTMAGVSQRAIMEVLGHRDPRMTMRYQHLAPGHLRDAMRALDTANSPVPTGTISAPAAQSESERSRKSAV